MLFVPTKAEMQVERTITIHGEVNYPGVYKYADNETLEDFVLQAGGLKETASTVKVDVARRISNPAAVRTDSVIARTYSFSLKDGFIIDGTSGFTLMPFDEVYVTDWNAFDFHMYTLAPENQDTYQLKARPWGGVCAIPQFIDTFDPDDQRLADWYITGQQYSYAGDSLFESTTGVPLDYPNVVPSIDESYPYQGYRWGKFEYAIGITNRLSNDWPQFRYADVLLMKAEALMRAGKPGAGALVTEVRQRAFGANPAKAVVSDADSNAGSCYDYGRRDTYSTAHEGGADIKYGRMLDELGWEFCQEGRRRQDLIRFGVFTTKSWFSHDASDATKNLYPIPNKIILTNSNLKQNPGY